MLSYNQGQSEKPIIFLVSIYDVFGRLQTILNSGKFTNIHFICTTSMFNQIDLWTVWSAATKRELLKLTQLIASETSMKIRVLEN